MPTVPTYEESVAPSDGVTARQASLTPQDFGSNLTSGIDSAQQGLNTLADYQAKQAELHDDAVHAQASLAFSTQAMPILHDPQNGILFKSGGDALNAQTDALQQLNDAKNSAISMAQNPRQKAMITQSINAQFTPLVQQVYDHVGQQQKQYTVDSQNAAAIQYNNNYVDTYQSDPALAQNYARTSDTYISLAMAKQGASPEMISNQLQVNATKRNQAVLDNMLSGGTTSADVAQANAYFIAHSAEMDPMTRASYATKVNQAMTVNGGADSMDASLAHLAAGAPTPAGSPAALAGPVAEANRALVANAGGTPQEQNDLGVIGHLEDPSGQNIKNPLPGATSYGRWQFTDATWAALGGTTADRDDPQVQAQLALKLYRQNQAGLATALGRQPTLMETYLAHQQGLAGATRLIEAAQSLPNELAVDTLSDAGVSNPEAAIINNLPASLKPLGDKVTASQFLQAWSANVAGTAGATATTPGVSPVINPTSGAFAGALPDKATAIAAAMSLAPPGASAEVQANFYAAAAARYEQRAATVQSASDAQDRAVANIYLNPQVTTWDQAKAAGAQAGLDPQHLFQVMQHYGGDKNFALEDDPKTLMALHQALVSNPAGFARTPLTDMTDNGSGVTAATFKQNLDLQDDIKNGKAAAKQKVETVSNIMSTTEAMLRSAGYIPLPNSKAPMTPQQAHSIAVFQQSMSGWADSFENQNNGKPPSPVQIQQRAGQLLAQTVETRMTPGVFGGPTASPPKPFLQADQAQQNFVPISQIPVVAQKQISAGYARRNGGKLPTTQQVENMYVDFKTQGIY